GKSSDEGYGDAVFATTEATNRPTLSSCVLGDTTATTIKVSARILSEGSSPVSECGFVYNDIKENVPLVGYHRNIQVKDNNGNMEAVLSGLHQSTTYYIRAYAKNDTEEYGYGEIIEYFVRPTSLPTVSTSAVTDITKTSAKVSGICSFDGNSKLKSKGFCWSTTNATPTVNDSRHEVSGDGSSFVAVLTGLVSGQKYYVRFYAENEMGVTYGDVMEFTTLAAVQEPTVSTSAATDITKTSAKVIGEITSDGGKTATSKGFCWSTTNTTPTVNDSKHEMSGDGPSFIAVLTGLASGQKYYVRFYAENEAGIAYGNVVEFTTIKITAPILQSTTVSQITTNSAWLSSSVASDGGAEVTSKGFCFSSTNTTPEIGGSGVTMKEVSLSEPFATAINELTDGTTYYVRSYAINSKGIGYSNIRLFTTRQIDIPDISGIWYCVEETNSRTYEYMLTLGEDGSIAIDGVGYSYLSGNWSLSKTGSFAATGHVIATQTQNSWDRYTGSVDNMTKPTKITGTRYRGNSNQVANTEDAVGTLTMTRTSSKPTPAEDDPVFPETR
ncbi:MAG: hypothetical protein NC206_11365, partial [Bacteroides sp.]|nr:hypothetical protein [Roseburia sp.]MCM1347666.1 hypothetical protein [Bacteroides sp.]MCM1422119.1 hypothetical protein [Bacteroides sp.]